MIKFGVFRLEGKVTIITGGASGIGASTARIFHENGAKVIIADIQDKVGQKIAHKLGEDVSYIHCDVMQEDDVAKLVDTTVHRHGKLDIMYNNAGVIDRKHGGIFDVTKFDLDKVVGVNVMDAFWGAKHATRVMIPKKNGCILFTSSATTNVAGLSTHSYASSKCAVLGLVRNLAVVELGKHGITVNCVAPYIVATGISGARVPAKAIEILTTSWANLKGRVLKADDIAMAVLYLASDDANYVSGLNLVVDGGYSFVNPSMLN
ncbi:LOW QUALITY PROTEIN: tropinone reductase-like 1 [Cucumis sativus]|uniref:LOW QUALITY PROTEIN: tropinone reductase-like 1 n=1 Tax=Cucumis sativus TaxID=3659 RepID=UPI0005EC0C4C|nr:LOW QUALITY PROTEIN: tropinone reductase-like 1 [Cucumis sativus]